MQYLLYEIYPTAASNSTILVIEYHYKNKKKAAPKGDKLNARIVFFTLRIPAYITSADKPKYFKARFAVVVHSIPLERNFLQINGKYFCSQIIGLKFFINFGIVAADKFRPRRPHETSRLDAPGVSSRKGGH